MNKKILVGSIIAVVIILFSSFSSVVGKVSSDNELVEFETEFCGLGKKHTVKLTREEAEEVETLFDEIKAQFDTVKTREEAEEIFKGAVVELDKYGLLGRLSVRQAQKFVSIGYNNNQILSKLESYLIRNSDYYSGNFLCLYASKIEDMYSTFNLNTPLKIIQGVNYKLFSSIITIMDWLVEDIGIPLYGTIATAMLVFLFFNAIGTSVIAHVSNLNPFSIANTILIGGYHFDKYGEIFYFGTEGWINTYGLYGLKNWSYSEIYGNLPLMTTPEFFFYPTQFAYYYPAVLGFTGLSIINFNDSNQYFLGTALWVEVSNEPQNV